MTPNPDPLQISVRNDFPHLLNQLNLLGTVVEIGVYDGEYGIWFRRHWKGKQYVMVDPWDHMDDYKDPMNASENVCLKRLATAIKRFDEVPVDQYRFIRALSLDAAPKFEDGSLDMAYIDGNHSYEHVAKDIAAWWPKIKKGGILAGHDYEPQWGLILAVDQFAKANDLQLRIIKEVASSWYVFKP